MPVAAVSLASSPVVCTPPPPPGVVPVDCSDIAVIKQPATVKFGVDIWNYWFQPQPDSALDTAKNAGIRWAKPLVPWAGLEVDDPATHPRHWEAYDAQLCALH